MRCTKKADIDPAGLQPVAEDLWHRHHRICRVGELTITDRERWLRGLRPDRAGFVDEHDIRRVHPPREIRSRARQADADEAHDAIGEFPRGDDGHDLVSGRLAHPVTTAPWMFASIQASKDSRSREISSHVT